MADGPVELLGRGPAVRSDGAYEGTLGGPAQLNRTAAAEAGVMLEPGRTGTVVIGETGPHCGRPLTLLLSRAPDTAADPARLGPRAYASHARRVYGTAPDTF
ncbi:hypothetical protein GCM10010251_47020 [Streptomyces aurantiogriseus]|uniref:Uncharacterized protein n=1 Tax=Streptomyces aurantiogriseus TaxID=66870 RepID=A0A918CJ76_9ACTN|nr:hypothetical protein GCM10010251_47020 [Streptomyces aurantiogriseus]